MKKLLFYVAAIGLSTGCSSLQQRATKMSNSLVGFSIADVQASLGKPTHQFKAGNSDVYQYRQCEGRGSMAFPIRCVNVNLTVQNDVVESVSVQ
jgi:hypothetical protein